MKILIAGAGIGGLTTALCLQRAGYDVAVHEQATHLSEIGAGIQCGANAMRVFRYLGLEDELRSVAVEPTAVLFRDYRSGGVLHELTLGKTYEQRYGAPYLNIYRADLQKALRQALEMRAPGSLVLGSAITGFEETQESVIAMTKAGVHLEANLLVAADGIDSTVRKQLVGSDVIKFTGNVAWRAVVPINRLPAASIDGVSTNFVGPGKHCVIYYLRNKKIANLVGVVENKEWQEVSWVAKASKSELRADFSGWHPAVTNLIDAVSPEQCYRWALSHTAPLNTWCSNRVTLLGDAAHATLPFMASGAAMAIEDARILERSLTSSQSVTNGLQVYQRNRQPRTRRIQQDSTRIGQLYHIKGNLVRRLAFKSIGLFAGNREAFLPAYDANTVELF